MTVRLALFAAAGACVAFGIGSSPAFIGYLLGLLASGMAYFSLWRTVYGMTASRAHPKRGAALTLLSLMIKLPMFGLAAYLAIQQGRPGFFGFLGGMALVYSCAIWSLAQRPASKPPPASQGP